MKVPVDASSATVLAPLADKVKSDGGGYYIGNDPATPEVGDLMIKYQIVRPTIVSLIAKQLDSTFEPYIAKTGGSIEVLELGTRSAENMFQEAQKENVLWTWLLRLVGFLLMLFGLMLVLQPLAVLADVLPVLGSIVEGGVLLVALLLAGAFALVTIAIAWLVYHPLLGIALLVVAAAIVFGLQGVLRRAATAVKAPA